MVPYQGRFALRIARVVLALACLAWYPFTTGARISSSLVFLIAYAIFAFGRDLMLALILGGAMLLVSASRRGSLNATLNAVYQTGATLGGFASAWLYGFRADFAANAVVASAVFAASALMLWSITKMKAPARQAAG